MRKWLIGLFLLILNLIGIFEFVFFGFYYGPDLATIGLGTILFINIGFLRKKVIKTLAIYFCLIMFLLIMDQCFVGKQAVICGNLKAKKLELITIIKGEDASDRHDDQLGVKIKGCGKCKSVQVIYKRPFIFRRIHITEFDKDLETGKAIFKTGSNKWLWKCLDEYNNTKN